MRIAVVTIIAALSATPAMAQGFGKSNRHQNQPSPEDTQKKKAAEAADRLIERRSATSPTKNQTTIRGEMRARVDRALLNEPRRRARRIERML